MYDKFLRVPKFHSMTMLHFSYVHKTESKHISVTSFLIDFFNNRYIVIIIYANLF